MGNVVYECDEVKRFFTSIKFSLDKQRLVVLQGSKITFDVR